MEELTRAGAENVAETLMTSLINIVDMVVQNGCVGVMKQQLEKMQGRHGCLEAWPFPETLNKADEMKYQLETFKAVVKLIEVREEQITNVKEGKKFAEGDEILKQLGF